MISYGKMFHHVERREQKIVEGGTGTILCPQCRKPYPASKFIGRKGKKTKLCQFCRDKMAGYARKYKNQKRGEI